MQPFECKGQTLIISQIFRLSSAHSLLHMVQIDLILYIFFTYSTTKSLPSCSFKNSISFYCLIKLGKNSTLNASKKVSQVMEEIKAPFFRFHQRSIVPLNMKVGSCTFYSGVASITSKSFSISLTQIFCY